MKNLERAAVWNRFGEPDEQIGSVNDPRTVREYGVSWNEKWIHLDKRGRVERVVLWDRYDLVGVFRVDADGSWHPDPLPEE